MAHNCPNCGGDDLKAGYPIGGGKSGMVCRDCSHADEYRAFV